MTKGHRGGSGAARRKGKLGTIPKGRQDTDEATPLGLHHDGDGIGGVAARRELQRDVQFGAKGRKAQTRSGGTGRSRRLSAWRTLQGIETVSMIRKGRVRWLAKGDAVGQAHFIGELFGLSA